MEMFHTFLRCLSPDGSLYHTPSVITLLQKTSRNDHYEMARSLLEELDYYHSYSIHSIWLIILTTIQDGNLKYTELILNSSATPNLDPQEDHSLRPLTQTMEATQKNPIHRLQAIKLLKASGKLDFNSISNRFSAESQSSPLQTLATLTDAKNQEALQTLLSSCQLDHQVRTDVLCNAVKSNNLPIVEILISRDTEWFLDNVLSGGLTLFQFAARYGNAMVVEFLLDKCYAWVDDKDANGYTTFWQAAHSRREPVAKVQTLIYPYKGTIYDSDRAKIEKLIRAAKKDPSLEINTEFVRSFMFG